MTWQHTIRVRRGKTVQGPQRLLAVLGEGSAQHAWSSSPKNRVGGHQCVPSKQQPLLFKQEGRTACRVAGHMNHPRPSGHIKDLVMFEGGQVTHALQSLRNPGDDDRTERDEAASWLTDWLIGNGGTAPRKDVVKAARAAGFSERTLNRAKSARQ